MTDKKQDHRRRESRGVKQRFKEKSGPVGSYRREAFSIEELSVQLLLMRSIHTHPQSQMQTCVY